MAIELNDERTMNPMVNAGAMATTSLVPAPPSRTVEFIRDGLSGSRGDSRTGSGGLRVGVRHQPPEPGHRHLLQSYGRLYADPTRPRPLHPPVLTPVNAADLAVMGRRWPVGSEPHDRAPGDRGVQLQARLAALATAVCTSTRATGLRGRLPGKSGVSGGIVTSRRQRWLGTFSPRWTSGEQCPGTTGDPVRLGKLGLNIFASKPVEVAPASAAGPADDQDTSTAVAYTRW